jgi:hypothetical protein
VDREFVACRLCGKSLRAVNYFHLALIHGWDSAHPIEEYKRKFRLARHVSPATRVKSIRSLHARLARAGKRWTRERLVALVASRKKRGLPLNMAAVRADVSMATTAARRYFGGWYGLLARCGVRPESARLRIRWSKERIIREIRQLARKGLRPSFQTALGICKSLPNAAKRHFGGWDPALRAAGFEPEGIRFTRHWSRRSIITAIRKLGGPFRTHEMEKLDSGLLAAGTRVFGSWSSASRAAGLPYSSKPRPLKWDRERILEALRRRAQAGRSLLSTVMRREAPGLLNACRRYFSTWRETVTAAGCANRLPPPLRPWKRAEILDALRGIQERHGFVTTSLVERSRRRGWVSLRRAVEVEFRGIARARKAAGVEARPRLLWTPERFRREIGRLRCPLRATSVGRAHPQLRNAAARIYGGWHPALRALGISHPGYASRWTREGIVRETRTLAKRGLTYGSKWANFNRAGLFRAAERVFGSRAAAARAAGCPQVAGRR